VCRGLVYTPLRRYAKEANGKVAIYDVGGLGHLAIQFAHALGFEVTAFSNSPSKERDALALGADRFVVVGDRARMRPFDYAFDVVLCTAHGRFDWEELMDVVVKRGRLVVVGFPDMSLDPTDLVAHELAITGSFIGSRETVREMLSFAAAHDIAPRIERLPMSLVNKAIARLKANRVRYRVVLDRA
jgi:D-arabinose 1-dehydrogenase-like Zn-dependent alcohol dehydrogenase